MLNQEYEWHDMRPIRKGIDYDVRLSFNGRPVKEQLAPGTILYRLDHPIVLGIFGKVWWMREAAFHRIFDRAGGTPSALRREWQNSLSMGKPGKGEEGKFGGWKGEADTRTQVLVIATTQPIFAWVGIASPLFHKSGGEEQVYLPNLARGTGTIRSDYARLLRTYTLPTI